MNYQILTDAYGGICLLLASILDVDDILPNPWREVVWNDR